MPETPSADPMIMMKRLARLYLTPEESLSLGQDLAKVLSWIGQLETLCVQDMQDTDHPNMAWREDVVTDGDDACLVLSNAPCAHDSFFTVPKVLKS